MQLIFKKNTKFWDCGQKNNSIVFLQQKTRFEFKAGQFGWGTRIRT